MNIKSLTIYCSSSNNLDDEYYSCTREISKILSNYGISVVYGGGQVGLMGELSKTSIELGNKVVGIIPEFLVDKEKAFFDDIDLKIVKNMQERKKLLFELGDGFLILPGGTGTLEELIEVISSKKLQLHNKPIIFFNLNNFWEPLFNQFEKIIDNKFANKNLQNLYEVIDNTHQLKEIIYSWKK